MDNLFSLSPEQSIKIKIFNNLNFRNKHVNFIIIINELVNRISEKVQTLWLEKQGCFFSSNTDLVSICTV